ncbi:MAG: diaminopimelate epimerase [Candidatus Cloacimonadota bacterium]|nr:diaminopimelate epimerase [Candidatus Cloacimonadota bacterium]
MLISFTKMQAQGNDFVILNYLDQAIPELDFAALAAAICKRNFGVGADGLVLIKPSLEADARMIIYNSDGSRAEMCGSALRCVSAMLGKRLDKQKLTIFTDAGLKSAVLQDENITVNLGAAQMLRSDYTVAGWQGDLIDIGNPHFVVFVDDLNSDPHLQYGAILEHHPAFATPVNVHFAKVLSPTKLQLKIWEHACGATLACGTGAAATVFAGIHKNLLSDSVDILLPGGQLHIAQDSRDGSMLLTGPVSESFTGIYKWKA